MTLPMSQIWSLCFVASQKHASRMKSVLKLRCLNDMVKRGSLHHVNGSSNYATGAFTSKSPPKLGLMLPQPHHCHSHTTQCVGATEIRRTMSYKTNKIRPSSQNIISHNLINDDQATLPPLDKPDHVAQNYTAGSHRSWKKLCQVLIVVFRTFSTITKYY